MFPENAVELQNIIVTTILPAILEHERAGKSIIEQLDDPGIKTQVLNQR
jgi:hypothetical protein